MKILSRGLLAMGVIVFMFGLIGSSTVFAAGPAAVNLLTAGNFTILSKTGITNTGSHTTSITGNIGSSPITAAAMNNVFCSEITGTIYGVDAAYTGSGATGCFAGNPGVPAVVPPDANKTLVDNAVLDMGTAYADAAGRTLPTATELGAGNIGGMTLAPGLYKWSTDVTIPTNVTLSGGANDVWIFQIAGNLNIASAGSVPAGIKVVLTGGAQASNIFWQVGGVTGATLGTYSTFNGTILSAKQVILQTGAVLNGRALAQTQVTLDANTIAAPTAVLSVATNRVQTSGTINIIKTVINDNGGTKTVADFPLFVSGTPVTSGVVNNFPAYARYIVTETSDPNYTQKFSGDCYSDGRIDLSVGDNKVCVVTNDDIGAAVGTPPVPPLIDVVKVPSPLALPEGPGAVTYTYTLRNIGLVPVTNVTMVGDTCGPISLVSGDINNDSKLDVNEVWTYRCTTRLSQTHTNTVTATGWANGLSAVDLASATVIVGSSVQPPLIHVTKVPSPLRLRAGGGVVTYTEKVTNPGMVALSNVRVVDDKCAATTYLSGDANRNAKLDTNETWTYTCESNITKNTTNIASASGEGNGLTAKDLAIATVLVAAPGLPNTGYGETAATTKGLTRAAALAAFHRSLGIGARGKDVEALQNALEAKGFLKMPRGVAKGYFGSLTRKAVEKYQEDGGLPKVGVFGPKTREKLTSELGE